ncbi:MAG: hypothetical protein AVDCRST_MAG68-3731, partial [uncultured Gemmatimonadetes bacterium]
GGAPGPGRRDALPEGGAPGAGPQRRDPRGGARPEDAGGAVRQGRRRGQADGAHPPGPPPAPQAHGQDPLPAGGRPAAHVDVRRRLAGPAARGHRLPRPPRAGGGRHHHRVARRAEPVRARGRERVRGGAQM